MTSLPSQIANVPEQVLERRAVPRLSLEQLNELDHDQLLDRLANTRRDDRPVVIRVLDMLDAPRNKIIANVFPTLEAEARKRGDVGTGGTGRVTGADILKSAGIDNRIINGIVGFGLDIATDPLTYLGPAGWGVQAGRVGIRKGGEKALRKGVAAAAEGGLGAVRDDAVRGLIEAGGLTAGRIDKLRGAAAAGRVDPKEVTNLITRRIKGDNTTGKVGSALARVGGDTTSQGGILGRALETTIGKTEYSQRQIKAAREFAAKYGRGTGPALKIGVPEGSVGSEIGHIPFTDRTLQVPAFTPVAKQAAVAQSIYRDKKLGIDILKDIPVVGAAHRSVQDIHRAVDSLDAENDSYATLAKAMQDRIDDGDNTAIDSLRALNDQRAVDLERADFSIKSLLDQSAANVDAAEKLLISDPSKFGPDAMLALGEMQQQAKEAIELLTKRRNMLDTARTTYGNITKAAEDATKAQTAPIERLLNIQESTRRGFGMKVASRNVTPNDAKVPSEFYPAGNPGDVPVMLSDVDALLPLTAKAKKQRMDELWSAMEKLPGGRSHPLWQQYDFERKVLEARPTLGTRIARIPGEDTSKFSRPYLLTTPEGMPTISGDANVRARVSAEIAPIVDELEQALKEHAAIQGDAQGGLFTGTNRIFADEFARSEQAISDLRDKLYRATAPLREDANQVPVEDWIDSIREANTRSNTPRAIQMLDAIADDPKGAGALSDALHSANEAAANYARVLDGTVSQFATGPQKELAEAVRYAVGASDISAGYSLTTPFATVAKNMFRNFKMNDESLTFRTLDAIGRSKRRTFGQRRGDQIRELARAKSAMRDAAMIANRDATERAVTELRRIQADFGIPAAHEDDFRRYVLAKTVLEANARDGVQTAQKIVKDGELVDGPLLEWLKSFEGDAPFKAAKPGVAEAVKAWASKTVDELHAIRDAELEDGVLESVLPGYVMSGLTPQGRLALSRQAGLSTFNRGGASKVGEEAFQRPRTTLKTMFQSPTTGEWKQFYEFDREVMNYSDAELANLLRHHPSEAENITKLRETIAEYDAMPIDAKPGMVAADPFELNQLYRDHGYFRMLTGSNPNVDRLFETDVALLLGNRLAQHTRAVGKANFRKIVASNGLRLDRSEVDRVAQKSGDELVSAGGVKVRVIANTRTPRGGFSPVLSINGVNYRFLDPDTVAAHDNPIMDALGDEVRQMAFTEQLADAIDDMAAYTNKTPDWLGHLQRATGIWKTSTLFHPSWIVSNVIGDTSNAMSGIVASGANPLKFFEYMKAAIKIRMAKGDPERLAKITLTAGGQKYTGQQLVEMFSGSRAWNDNAVAEIMYQLIQNGQYALPSQRGAAGVGVSEDMKYLLNLYGQPLKKLGKGGEMIATGAAGARIGMDRLGRHIVGPFMHANAFVSDAMRSAALLTHLDNGDDIGAAAEKVRRTMFDYSEFSRFEDRTLRPLFPFYSWMRNNLSYQLQMLLERPAYAANFPRLKETIEEMIAGDEQVPENMRPKWMQSQFALQVGADPSSRFAFMLGNTVPQADIFNLIAPIAGPEGAQHFAKYFVSGINPIVSFPVQAGAGVEFFSGRTIGSAETDDQSLGEFAARQIRPLNELGFGLTAGRIPDAFGRGIGQGVARTVLGGRVQAFDEERLRTSRLSELKKEEEGLRRQIRRAERNGDKELSLAARAKLIQLYEQMASSGLADEVPKWALKMLPQLSN